MGETQLTLLLILRGKGGEEIEDHRLASGEILLDLGAPGRRRQWQHHGALDQYQVAFRYRICS